MTMIVRSVVLALAVAVFVPSVQAESNWPQWRGPKLNGSSDAKNLPNKLDKASAKWATKMPGASAGTPIVWGDRVFVSSLDQQSQKLLALCLDRKDGRVLWRKEVGQGAFTNRRNNHASPSPITDGKHVWFYYGNGDLACFDVEGKPVWSRSIEKEYGPFHYQWTYGSSPLLWEGKLFIQVLHRDVPAHGPRPQGAQPAESYLLAIDPMTGKDLWRQVRPEEAAAESKESYGTPIPFFGSPRKEIVVIGGDVVTGHDPETGKEFWRFGGWNPDKIGHWRIVPSVLTAEGLAIACAPKGGPVMAIKAGGEGEITSTHAAWISRDFTSDVTVPLYYKGNLYVLDGDGPKKLSCVELKSGKVKWSGNLGGGAVFRASPTGADDKIYCMNERGEVWVLSADEFKVLYKGELGGAEWPTRSTIAVVDGNVFVRTSDMLYCFGTR